MTDAGSPVKDAAVHFAGKTSHTNAHGVTRLAVSHHLAAHRYHVHVTKHGYAGTTLTLTVRC